MDAGVMGGLVRATASGPQTEQEEHPPSGLMARANKEHIASIKAEAQDAFKEINEHHRQEGQRHRHNVPGHSEVRADKSYGEVAAED